jgi:hypothetical protein
MGGGNLGMLVMSKLGSLWLIDITENDTIKVMSVHSNSIKSGEDYNETN